MYAEIARVLQDDVDAAGEIAAEAVKKAKGGDWAASGGWLPGAEAKTGNTHTQTE